MEELGGGSVEDLAASAACLVDDRVTLGDMRSCFSILSVPSTSQRQGGEPRAEGEKAS